VAGKILVTGGAGFLGSHFIRQALEAGAESVVNVDALTYAGDVRRLAEFEADPRYKFVRADVSDESAIKATVAAERPDLIVHYAAETHVTRSEADPDRFYRTNLEGTKCMLEAARAGGVERFVHISTDEVYGPILEGSFAESDKLPGDVQASSPYAKSKALADDLAHSYTDKLEVVVARPTNAFGPWQFPEKAFPRWVTRALRGEPLLVWGDGLYKRQWLFAGDFARAIALLAAVGKTGEAYNVGPLHDPEITNLDLASWLVGHLGLPAESVQLTAYDRPDHDRRYAVDPGKINALGWHSGVVESQLSDTVGWYVNNEPWWREHIAEAESIYKETVS